MTPTPSPEQPLVHSSFPEEGAERSPCLQRTDLNIPAPEHVAGVVLTGVARPGAGAVEVPSVVWQPRLSLAGPRKVTETAGGTGGVGSGCPEPGPTSLTGHLWAQDAVAPVQAPSGAWPVGTRPKRLPPVLGAREQPAQPGCSWRSGDGHAVFKQGPRGCRAAGVPVGSPGSSPGETEFVTQPRV